MVTRTLESTPPSLLEVCTLTILMFLILLHCKSLYFDGYFLLKTLISGFILKKVPTYHRPFFVTVKFLLLIFNETIVVKYLIFFFICL